MKSITTFLGYILALTVLFTACQSPTDSDNSSGNNSDGGSTNQAPVAEASVSEKTVSVGDQVTLNGSGSSDPDGDDISFEWALSSPSGSNVTLSDSKAEKPTFTPDKAGDYVAALTVDDGNGGSDQDEITITAESGVVEISSDISSDETLTKGNLYRVTTDIEVNSGAILTIEAGVTVEFAANAGIRINSNNSALVVNGTASDSVRLTGVQKSAGFWRGIAFDSSNPKNKLEYTVVEYGGYESWSYISEAANVSLRDGGSSVTLTNSTFQHSGSFGLFAESSTDLPNFANNTFTNNAVPMGIPTTLMGGLDGGSKYTGNSEDYVLVKKQDVNNDMTVSALDAPYRIENDPHIESDAQVTIEAGTTIEFKANAGLRVNSDNAALIVNGESGSPVTFTGVQKSPGFWRGIAFDSSHPFNKLNHTVVEYGGYESWSYISEAANVSLRDGGSNVSIINSTFRYSGNFGIYAESSTDFSNFDSNLVTKNAVPMGIPTTLMGAPDGASIYTGNTNDHILVEKQDVNNDMTVSALDVPYRIENDPHIESDAQVTIEAGTTIKFKANAGLRVNSDNAALIVNGESGSPVTFTGVQKSPGFWRGLAIDSSNPNNNIDYAVIEYGGYESWAYISEAANVALRDGAQLTLTNSTLRNSGAYGGWADDGTGASISFSGNSYSNNSGGNNNYGD